MTTYLTTDTELTTVADSIRTKGGTSASLEWPTGFVNAISAIPSGGGDDSAYKAFVARSTNTPTFPNGITEIGNYACYYWSALTLSSLPDTITRIGNNAFYYCTGLTLSSLPDSVTSIGSGAFSGCSGITLSSVPSGVTLLETSVFYNCTGLTVFSLPSSVTSISGSAFYNCTGLTTITASGVVTNLAQASFNKCTSLVRAEFPNATLTSCSPVFGSTTPSNACRKLETVDLGNTMSLAANAFANCYKLQTLVLRRTSVVTLANVSAFVSTPMRGYNSLTGTVYVPNSLISSYKTANNWKTLYDNGTVTFAAIEGSEWEL